MSSSDGTNFTQKGSAKGDARNQVNTSISSKMLRITTKVQQEDKPVRLEGEVGKQERKNELNIKTQEGWVTLKLSEQAANNPALFPEGQKIEIEIPSKNDVEKLDKPLVLHIINDKPSIDTSGVDKGTPPQSPAVKTPPPEISNTGAQQPPLSKIQNSILISVQSDTGATSQKTEPTHNNTGNTLSPNLAAYQSKSDAPNTIFPIRATLSPLPNIDLENIPKLSLKELISSAQPLQNTSAQMHSGVEGIAAAPTATTEIAAKNATHNINTTHISTTKTPDAPNRAQSLDSTTTNVNVNASSSTLSAPNTDQTALTPKSAQSSQNIEENTLPNHPRPQKTTAIDNSALIQNSAASAPTSAALDNQEKRASEAPTLQSILSAQKTSISVQIEKMPETQAKSESAQSKPNPLETNPSPQTTASAQQTSAMAHEQGAQNAMPKSAKEQNAPEPNTQDQRAATAFEGNTKDGFAVLSWSAPNGNQAYFSASIPLNNVQEGAQLNITAPNTAIAGPLEQSSFSAQNLPAITAQYMLTPGPWHSMQEIAQSLAAQNTAIAQNMNASIPSMQSPANIGPAALFFITALRVSDLGQWLGDKAMDELKRSGKGDMVSRLGQEGSAISKLASESISNDWRALTLPFLWDNEIYKTALYYKHEHFDEQDDDASGLKQTRFILDLKLTNMGNVQLDGLWKQPDNALNMALRTERPFTNAMQSTLQHNYREALEAAGLTGDLTYQGHLDSFVKIQSENQEFSTSA